MFFFFKQKTAYEMRIIDWSSDVCSSDLTAGRLHELGRDMSFEHVAEARREREVDVEEVRHVHDVVDDLAAVRVGDVEDLPGPVGVLLGADPGRSEARRVGTEWVSSCSISWSQDTEHKT